MQAPLDPQARIRKQEALLHQANDVLRRMRAEAEEGRADAVDAQAKMFEELLKIDIFPSSRRNEYRDRVRAVQCAAHQKSLDTLLHQVEKLVNQEDVKARNELLGKVAQQLSAALRFGADEEFKKGVSRRLTLVVQRTGEGIDRRAKEAAARKAAQDLQNGHGPRGPGGIERRRTLRYAEPALSVTFDNQTYHTVNWSNRGMLIENFHDHLPVGEKVKLQVTCDGIKGGGRIIAWVVRYDPSCDGIAFDFDATSEVILDLVHEMKRAGQHPIPQR